MIKLVHSSSPLIIAICVLMMIQLVGCGGGNDDDGDNDANLSDEITSTAPPLPPDESMTVDLSLFDEGAANDLRAPSAVATYMNFGNAVTRVAAVNAALAAAVAAPATVFTAARLHAPVPQSDGSWLWSYSVTIEYVTFTASLNGIIEGDESRWSMVVSTNAPLRPVMSFLWYKGVCTDKNTAGEWEFFDITTPTEQNPVVKVNWTADVDNKTAHLILENVDTRPDAEYAGDVLDYSAGTELAFISYTDVSENAVWDITWNTETGEGSLKVPEYNGGAKACWNNLKQDVTCL